MTVECQLVDYSEPLQAKALVQLLDEYARDPMGGREGLKPEAIQNLASELGRRSHAFSFIAYGDGRPAGLANCFEGFSTFQCKPLINIHDLAVSKAFRGHQISYRLLESVEAIAKERGCCKITLEVLSENAIAKKTYSNFGFEAYQLDPKLGSALFMEKGLV